MRTGPRGPTVMEFWLSPTGRPDVVVMCGQDAWPGLSDGFSSLSDGIMNTIISRIKPNGLNFRRARWRGQGASPGQRQREGVAQPSLSAPGPGGPPRKVRL